MGWNYIGFVSNAAIMPYSDVYVGNNFEVKTMADAIDAFWVDPNASKYDNVTRSLWTVGIDFCDLTYLEKGLGYELLAHSDALMLMYPANPGAPWPGTPTTGSIPAAKTSLDSTQVTLTGKVVSAVFPAEGYCYIQDPAPGFAAIRLDGVTTYPPRSVLDITGTVATASNGERYLQPTSILRQDILEEIQPAAMNNRAVLSGDLAGGSVTAAGATAGRGHHHVGTLIKTNGKVTAVGTGFFYLWDGSYPYGTTSPITDDTPNNGIRVEVPGDYAGYLPVVNELVTVTGIASLRYVTPNYYATFKLVTAAISTERRKTDISDVLEVADEATVDWQPLVVVPSLQRTVQAQNKT